MKNQPQVEKLSKEFSKVLKSWLMKKQMAEVIRKNDTPEYKTGGLCASHDYCDANMAMDAAWKKVVGKSINFQNNTQVSLWNKAWTMAKENKFYIS